MFYTGDNQQGYLAYFAYYPVDSFCIRLLFVLFLFQTIEEIMNGSFLDGYDPYFSVGEKCLAGVPVFKAEILRLVQALPDL